MEFPAANLRPAKRSELMATIVFGLMVLLCGCSGTANNTDVNAPATVVQPSGGNNDARDKDAVEKSEPSEVDVPHNDEVQGLVKATLLDFNEAVQVRDFSEFYTSISDEWQMSITPEKFEEAFSEFIEKGVDISQISALDASFSSAPRVVKDSGRDVLSIEGSYETVPVKTKFELKFISEGGDWKLSRIRVVVK